MKETFHFVIALAIIGCIYNVCLWCYNGVTWLWNNDVTGAILRTLIVAGCVIGAFLALLAMLYAIVRVVRLAWHKG